MDKIEKKEKMQELNRFLEGKADEGLSAETVKVYFWQVLDFMKHCDEMTEESLSVYIEAAEKRGVDKESLRIYQRSIKQFIDFVNGVSPKKERKRKRKRKEASAVRDCNGGKLC